MLYIITYATHNERYFDILKKSYPNIIVLGYGKKWNGFYDKVKATIDFCKDKNDDDLILFVDGFDSVVLHTDDLIEKYKSFNVPLIFSHDIKQSSITSKYMHDVIFNTCQSVSLNSGMYIGPPKEIINFWKDIKIDDDDQIYATKKCNELDKNKIIIDTEYKLFFNYLVNDKETMSKIKIDTNLNKLKIDNEYPNIISAPAFGNINDILIKLGYNNISKKLINDDDKKIHFDKRLYFYKNFIFEIIFLIIIILIMYFIKNKINGFIICLLLFLELIHYQLFIKHINTDNIYKLIYILLDLFHMTIIYMIYYLFNNAMCDINKLLLL